MGPLLLPSGKHTSAVWPIAIMALALVAVLVMIDTAVHQASTNNNDNQTVINSNSSLSNNAHQVVCTREAKICPDGTTVGRVGPNCEFETCPDFGQEEEAGAFDGCIISGCSFQLCGEMEKTSTCIFQAEYACYAKARCERRADGLCGWTETKAFQQCIRDVTAGS